MVELVKRLLGFRSDGMKLARLGREAYGEGHPHLAELTLTRATKVSPDDPALHVALAEIAYARGHDEDARASYETATRLDATRPEPLLGMAASLHRMGRASEAVYYYLAYLDKRPGDVRALLSLAIAFHSAAEYEAEIEVLERAERLTADDPEVEGQHGKALYEMGRNAEAIKKLSRAIDLGSQDAQVFRGLGLAFGMEGRVEDARPRFERAIEMNPESGWTRIEFARVLTGWRRPTPEEAQVGVVQAVRGVELLRAQGRPSEEMARALWELGWAYYCVADWTASIEASRESLETDPGNPPVRFNLGLALLRAGKRDEALVEYQRASEEVENLWELSAHGIDDLRATEQSAPDLPGRKEILAMLQDRYEELKNRRSPAAVDS